MRKKYFVNEEQFRKWNEEGFHYLTAVYDDRGFVCDVEQKDFLYLQDIGFLNGASIIPALTIEHTEMFKDSYGVEVIYYEDLYDEICKVLTWLEHPEESPFRTMEEFEEEIYNLLVRVQNELFNN